MTVLAAEAGEAVGARAAAGARGGAGRHRGAPARGRPKTQEAKGSHARPPATRTGQAGDVVSQRTAQGIREAPGAYGSQAAAVGRGAQVTPGSRGYQPVILAEFLAAVAIVALVPIASGGSPAAVAKGSPSPYDTGDLRQLVAVGAVYFVLALASSGNSGRLSAWLGGLILIALAMSKLAHGSLTAVFNTVSGQNATAGDQQPGQAA